MTERLLEEVFSSTDIAAAALQSLIGGGDLPPEPEPVPQKKSMPSADGGPVRLRPAARGMQWVRIDVGRESRINPREVVFLLEEALGLPGRSVGIIDLARGESFAQVPQQFTDILRQGARSVDTQGGPVSVSLVREDYDSKPKKKKFK